MRGNNRIVCMAYDALAGLSAGLALAIAAEQWTWLDMRCNTGILAPLAILAGAAIGYIRGRVEALTGPLCLLALILVVLVSTGGNLAFAAIIVGVTLRDGFGMPDLSLLLADRLALLLALGSLIVFACFRRRRDM